MEVEEIRDIRAEARELIEEEGLDPYPVKFGVVSKEQMDELSAYRGFPERYPHWRFGMAYDTQKKKSSYGGMRLYELVINSNPALAYLREDNTRIQTKSIMVHVYAHSDFFKNNRWFEATRGDMQKVMADHASKIERLMESRGRDQVESFLDKVLSIEYSIDQYLPYMSERDKEEEKEEEPEEIPTRREYMERYINPPRREGGEEEAETEKGQDLPTEDLLGYLEENGRLKDWKREVVSMIREESYYFAPQVMTKVMNEGWAAYWQSKIMAEEGFAGEEEIIDYADMQSKVLGGGGINPYFLGERIWEDIKERWDRGMYGKKWEECRDREKLEEWDRKEGKGREKIHRARRNLDDVMFLDSFFRKKLFEEMKLFSYEWIEESGKYHITSRDFRSVKRKLLFRFTNLGRPTVRVETGNFQNRGELLLIHEFDGVNLDLEEAGKVLENIYHLWGRPVNLKTVIRERKGKILPVKPGGEAVESGEKATPEKRDRPIRLRFGGEEVEKEKLGEKELKDLVFEDRDYDTLPASWFR